MNFKVFKRGLFLLLILVAMMQATVFADTYGFDEYGFKIEETSDQPVLKAAAISWEELDSKQNVPLDKMWTVEFSGKVTMDKIEAIAIERDGDFIPVRISLMGGNKAGITPAEAFTGDTSYTLKIFLANGHNYKMGFTTVSEYRNIDVEPNYVYTDAQSLYINETVKGSFAEEDYNDFYKIVLPEDGTLDLKAVQLEGGALDLYLYGEDGDDASDIKYDYNDTTCRIKAGLEAGIYYVKLNYSGDYGKYEFTNTFTPEEAGNDSAHYSYVKAQEIDLNTTVQGHIGYVSDSNSGDYTDFYKIEIPEDGELDVMAMQLDGKELDLYLYGEDGDDASEIDYEYSDTTCRIKAGLEAGTYYVKVYYSGNYGGYELTNDFTAQEAGNDSAHYSYVKAQEIGLNTTVQGHIGYKSAANSGDYTDFYKIVLPQDGTLDVTALQLDGGKLDLYLYGEDGDDASDISYAYSDTTARINEVLQAGTYYIKIYYSGYYGGYELTNSFN